MDQDARAGTLRALELVSKAAVLAASYTLHSREWIEACSGAERAAERAERHYEVFRGDHPSHLRLVRTVRTAVEHGAELVLRLGTARDTDDVDDIVFLAEKLDRAIARANPDLGAPASPPPPSP